MSLAGRWRRGRWRLYAPVYDRLAAPFESGRARAVDLLDPRPDDRILLVGVWTCRTSPPTPARRPSTSSPRTSGGPASGRRTSTGRSTPSSATRPTSRSRTTPSAPSVSTSCSRSSPTRRPSSRRSTASSAPGGRVSVFDEFLPDGASPSLLRRALNPAVRLLFSDLTRQLGPPVAGTDLAVREREWLLWGLYSVALLRPAASSGRRTPDS